MEETYEITPHEAMMRNMQIMQAIVAEMKEIPVLPSEEPKDVAPLLKVEFPEKGGILTHMGGHEHPYKGFPFYEFVDKIDLFKKVSRSALSGFYHALKGKNYLWLITLLPAAWIFKVTVRVIVYTFYRQIERFRIKPIRHCDAIRELHRAMSIDRDNELVVTKEFRLQLRDLICGILEFDNAYRFRFQDLMEEIDKDKLVKNSTKEIVRLFEIMQSRETGEDVVNTWTLFKLFTKLYFWMDKELRNIFRDALLEINLEEVKLSVEDKHYCRPRKDYVFGFALKEQNNVSN